MIVLGLIDVLVKHEELTEDVVSVGKGSAIGIAPGEPIINLFLVGLLLKKCLGE